MLPNVVREHNKSIILPYLSGTCSHLRLAVFLWLLIPQCCNGGGQKQN